MNDVYVLFLNTYNYQRLSRSLKFLRIWKFNLLVLIKFLCVFFCFKFLIRVYDYILLYFKHSHLNLISERHLMLQLSDSKTKKKNRRKDEIDMELDLYKNNYILSTLNSCLLPCCNHVFAISWHKDCNPLWQHLHTILYRLFANENDNHNDNGETIFNE